MIYSLSFIKHLLQFTKNCSIMNVVGFWLLFHNLIFLPLWPFPAYLFYWNGFSLSWVFIHYAGLFFCCLIRSWSNWLLNLKWPLFFSMASGSISFQYWLRMAYLFCCIWCRIIGLSVRIIKSYWYGCFIYSIYLHSYWTVLILFFIDLRRKEQRVICLHVKLQGI